MDRAFILQHERTDSEHVKFIGVYSSQKAAKATIQRLRLQPGFSDYPDGFTVDAYEFDKDHWTEGFVDL